MMIRIFFFILIIVICSCKNEQIPTPKLRMYPEVNFPANFKDTLINLKQCPFSFNVNSYLKYKQDSFYFEERTVNDCWFDLTCKELNTSIHCSYYPIDKRNTLDSLINDAFAITNKHNVKANARRESVITNQNGIGGLLFEVDGPVASPIQFYLTDSTKHFLRGSLYFNASVNQDSTKPVLNFIRKDLERMIETFKWKK